MIVLPLILICHIIKCWIFRKALSLIPSVIFLVFAFLLTKWNDSEVIIFNLGILSGSEERGLCEDWG